MRGVTANRRRTADTPNLAAQGQSVSRKTVAEVPLTGLSFFAKTVDWFLGKNAEGKTTAVDAARLRRGVLTANRGL